MTRKRRSFPPEFKQEAASLVLDQGYTISQAGVSLGVGETTSTALDAANWRLFGTVYRSRPNQKRHWRARRLSDAGRVFSVTAVWFAWFARFHDLDQR